MIKFELPKVLVSLDEKVTKIVLDKKAAMTKAKFLASKTPVNKVKFFLTAPQRFTVVGGFEGQTALISEGGPFEMTYDAANFVGEAKGPKQGENIQVSMFYTSFEELVTAGIVQVVSFS